MCLLLNPKRMLPAIIPVEEDPVYIAPGNETQISLAEMQCQV
jgi:hypothetical protein